jgi:hypothetical protein
MFDPVPEKPPHMAGRFLVIFGTVGGIASIALVGWLLGPERFATSNAWLLGSFAPGAALGVFLGWKAIMPRPPVIPRESDPTPLLAPPIEQRRPSLTSEALLAVGSRLNASLWVAVAAVSATILWAASIGTEGPSWVRPVLVLFQLGSYLWIAACVGATARALNEPSWRYVAWVIAAPFLALIPIPVVSTLIAVSPLSLKFFLGAQLDQRIRERTFED